MAEAAAIEISGVAPPDEATGAVAVTLVTPELLEVPAPIRVLTSAALMPLFKLGSVPSLNIAGTPVSVTFAVLLTIAVA